MKSMKRLTALALMICLAVCSLPVLAETVYKQGDSGKEIMAIKQRMFELGYYTAAPNHNQFNDTMTERVKQLQKINGLEETGKIDESLYALIMSDNVLAKNGKPSGALSEGDKGQKVLEVKKRMAELLYFDSDKGLNNAFNDTMTERVKLLQKLNGLEETGVITPSLYELIMSDQCVACGDYYDRELTAANRFNYELSGEKLYSVSSSGNVIIFIVDYFANNYLSSAQRKYPQMLAPFHDFTYYSNCDPRYIGTYPSITHMLTGHAFDPSQMVGEWFRDAWQSETANYIFDTIHAQGYEFRYYYYTSISDGMMADAIGKVDNLIDRRTYTGGEIPEIYSYTDFNDHLKARGLTVDQTDKKYIQMIHLRGAHAPYSANAQGEYKKNASREENIAGYMSMVASYMDLLKAEGLYDDATIIITSDHGAKDANMQVVYWIKQAGETHDSVQQNAAPISHTDFPGTLLHVIGADYSQYGTSIFDWNPGDRRERQCSMVGSDFNTYPRVSCYSDPGLGSHNFWRTYTYTGNGQELMKVYKRGKYSHVPLAQSFN